MRRGAVRLVALTSVAVALLVALVGGIGLWRAASDRVDAQAKAETAQVAEAARLSASPDALRDAVARTDLGGRGLLGVRAANGSTIGTAHAGAAQIAAAGPDVTTVDLPDGFSLLRRVPGGTVVEAFVPDGTVFGAVVGEYAVLLAVCVLAVALAVITALVAVRPLLARLRRLQDAVASLRDGELDRAVRIRGPIELTLLGTTVNGVSRRVRELVTRERAMVADLSHRMRTPLTALRLDADGIGASPQADRIRGAVTSLEQHLGEVIRCAEPAAAAVARTCDAAELVRTRMRFWAALAEHQGRPCRFDVPDHPAAVALADADLTAVIDALVTNVFQHTGPTAALEVTLVRHAGWLTLVVEDGGPGIADVPAALRRGAGSTGSTGLGLAIAQDTAAACDGGIRVDRGRLGGTRIQLRLAEFGVEHATAGPLACRILPRYRDRTPPPEPTPENKRATSWVRRIRPRWL